MTANGHVLVVDDDDDIRYLVSVILEMAGYEVSSACDGEEALHELKEHEPPAVVILDLMMPRMNGEDLLRWLQQDRRLRRVPVVVISGQPGTSERAMELGARAHLLKPVDADDLLSTVDSLAHR